MTGRDIKTMKLYHQVERVFKELRALGVGDQDPIRVDDLIPHDQYHYLGTDAVDEAIRRLALDGSKHVLDVGAGIGGPARYLAHRSGCRVTALELQTDLNDTAIRLTQRCGLSHLVTHRCGNALDGQEDEATFDALVSWLTFLHIADRQTLYRRCHEALRPGGQLFVEDYFELGSLSVQERKVLEHEVYCHYVPTLNDYSTQLAQAGFDQIELTDMTDAWLPFLAKRREGYSRDRERNVRVHGPEIVNALETFYATVVDLFEGGNLGGVRVIATKP